MQNINPVAPKVPVDTSGKSCANCVHLKKNEFQAEQGGPASFCTRFPPTVIVVYKEEGPGFHSIMPAIEMADIHSCGEFTKKETKKVKKRKK